MKRLFPSFGAKALVLPQAAPPTALETKGDVERRATSGGVYIPAGGTPYRTSWSVERAVSDGLERVVWVYRCVDAIASDESRLPMTWRSGHPIEGDEIKPAAEPLWRLLNRRANPWESASAFRYRLSCQLLLCKQGVFIEIQRNRDKSVRALYLLPPHRTAPMPDPDKFLSGYEVYGSQGEVYRLPPEQVLWIRRPHPLDPYMGLTPMEAAGLAVDVDFYARLYNRNFMMNDGRPGGIVNVKGFLSEEDADEMEARFSGGPGRAGKITVLESDGVEYVDTSTSARDMQHSETRTSTRKEILAAFGVPESRAGDTSGRTFDNADAEIEGYWRDTMRAHCDLLDSGFDTLTAGGIEDDIFTVHDTTSVYVLNRDEKDKEQRFQNLWNAGLITADEFRAATGREPMKRPGSEVLWVNNSGKLPVGEEDDEKELLQVMSGGGMEEAPAAVEGEGEGAEGMAAEEGEAAPGTPPPDDFDWDSWSADSGEEGGTEGFGGAGGGGGTAYNGNGNGNGSGDVDREGISAWSWGGKWVAEGTEVKDGMAAPDTEAPPPPTSTGIMISVDIPDRTARTVLSALTPDTGALTEPAENLHITLAYLGKVDSAPFAVESVLEAVDHFSALSSPIVCAVSGIGHFSIPDGTATYASVDCPALPDFRQRLVHMLEAVGIEPASDHGFTPHITLAYTPPGAEPPDIPIEELAGQITSLTFPVAEVSVHWGDDCYRFQLAGTKTLLVNLGMT